MLQHGFASMMLRVGIRNCLLVFGNPATVSPYIEHELGQYSPTHI